MQDDRFPIGVVNGVPVAAAPEEIDITNAQELRAAPLAPVNRRRRDAAIPPVQPGRS